MTLSDWLTVAANMAFCRQPDFAGTCAIFDGFCGWPSDSFQRPPTRASEDEDTFQVSTLLDNYTRFARFCYVSQDKADNQLLLAVSMDACSLWLDLEIDHIKFVRLIV